MVELTAAVASGIEWFVNNERILPQHDNRFFWQLAPGEWRVRVVSRVGTAEETITVEWEFGIAWQQTIPNVRSRAVMRCRWSCDYCYWQPGSLKLPMRVCQGAVVPGGGNGGGGRGRGSPLTS